MNENIDLRNILKNCPKGWEFYSSVLGEVEFEGIFDDRKQADCIVVRTCKLGYTTGYTKEGFYLKGKGECTLFPSKDQRDWSKFTAPWYKKEPEQNMEAIQINQEVTALLEAFGYKPRVKVNKPTVGLKEMASNKEKEYSHGKAKGIESDTFESVLDEMKELHAKKDKDYGSAFHKSFEEFGVTAGVVRLNDKMERVKSLVKNGKAEVKDDSLLDSLKDLGCYAVMLYVELKNKENGTDKD